MNKTTPTGVAAAVGGKIKWVIDIGQTAPKALAAPDGHRYGFQIEHPEHTQIVSIMARAKLLLLAAVDTYIFSGPISDRRQFDEWFYIQIVSFKR